MCVDRDAVFHFRTGHGKFGIKLILTMYNYNAIIFKKTPGFEITTFSSLFSYYKAIYLTDTLSTILRNTGKMF